MPSKIMTYIKKDIVQFIVVISLALNFGVGTFELVGSDAVPEYVKQMVHKMDVVYGYTCDEMIRFVDKQYIKVTEKPDDFYPSDLEYCFDNVWPNIPENRKSKSLVAKYDYLVNFYETQLASSRQGIKLGFLTKN